MQRVPTQRRPDFRPAAIAVASAALFAALPARAFQIDAGPDWRVNFDNTVLYNLGIRAQQIDSRIGSDPTLQESDYSFAKRGDVVTNLLSLLSEFDAVYQRRMGLRLSASGWKDFAYGDRPNQNPNYYVAPIPGVFPGAPYPTNYNNGEYSSYTKRYQVEGAELLDAFVFANFDLGGRPATIKLGKLTQFWGNALFFSSAGISFSQSASDNIKQLTAPGTQAKELAMPRGQINFSTQVTDEVQLGAQYFLQWQADRYPSGGTFLAPATDFLFEGPDRFGLMDTLTALGVPGAAPMPRAESAHPSNNNGNFGVQAKWSPAWLDGTLGFYYRQFDETAPWNPIFGMSMTPTGPSFFYRLAYPEKTKMLAASLDKQIGGASVGFELSYRKGTGLNTNGSVPLLTAGVPSATDPDSVRGARGDTLNFVANALSILDRTSLYSTGTALAEIAVIHKLKVTDQADRYQGEGTAACDAAAAAAGVTTGGGRYTSCSTDTAVVIGGMFEPQWLQALPSWDLSLPMFGMYGLSGNAASNGVPVKQGDLMYGLGFKAVLQQRYNFTLQYNGFHGHATGMSQTPAGAQFYATGNNMYRFNDRNWLSFTFQTTF